MVVPLVRRAPTLHQFIISTAANPPQARRQLARFGQSALRSELRDQPLLVVLPDLEEAAVAHRDNFAITLSRRQAPTLKPLCRRSYASTLPLMAISKALAGAPTGRLGPGLARR